MIKSGNVVSFLVLIFLSILIIVITRYIKKGWRPNIRSIPAIDAIEEFIGAAVEMNRPVLINMGMVNFVPVGIADMNIMAHSVLIGAKMGAKMIIPIARPRVMPTVTEMVRTAYVSAGVPEDFNPSEQIPFLTPLKWAFTATIQKMLEDLKPAAHIFVGEVGGAAMILLETAARVGCLQIGGSTNTMQIPFYVAVCDYTLICEEVFTAGAVLSKDPSAMSQIAMQDIFELLSLGLMILGIFLASIGSPILTGLLSR